MMGDTVEDRDYIIEIYNIPEGSNTGYVVEIFREFRNKYLLIRWVDDSTALGVFENADEARKALENLNHPTVRCRNLSEASPESIEKAMAHRRKDLDTDQGARPKSKIRVFYDVDGDLTSTANPEEEESRSSNSRGRARGRRGSRGAFSMPSDSPDERGRGNRGRFRSERGGYRGRGTGRGRQVEVTQLRDQKIVHDMLDHSDTDENYNTNVTDKGNTKSSTQHSKKPYMAFGKIVALSKMIDDSSTVLLEVGNTRSGFKEVLEADPFQMDRLAYILRIMVIVSSSTEMHSKRQVMLTFEDVFLNRMNDILNNISIRSADVNILFQDTKQLFGICQLSAQVLLSVMTVVRKSLGKYKSIIRVIEEIRSTFNLDESLLSELNDCEEVLKSLKEENDQMYKMSDMPKNARQRITDENRPPPNSFREIEILPCSEDIKLDEKPFLRANKQKGKFNDLETYLDIQFRLLREDYMQPLRIGITEYKRLKKQSTSIKKIREIRLYNSVQILRPVCSPSGLNHKIQFDNSQLKTLNWAASRRLLHGSLLCLSCDDFETNFYATVRDRKQTDLAHGVIEVHFEDGLGGELNLNATFLMAETTAFFEAYRHILAGLQEIGDNLPFQRYLINCEPLVKPPNYLLEASPQYDLSCLLQNKNATDTHYPVLNIQRWPKQADVIFDESQFNAVKTAITKELAIIQGPPGTGKTFIGLKIAQVLIENRIVWNASLKGCPIFVVCYTNHALDQFLNGILEFCGEGIVRCGGRCKDENLEQFVLSKIKMKRKLEKSRSFNIMQSERDCYFVLRDLETKISHVSKKLENTFSKLLHPSKFEMLLTKEQKMCFVHLQKRLGDCPEEICLSKWLGLEIKLEKSMGDQDPTLLKNKEWEFLIVSSITEMPVNEKLQVDDVWRLNLHQRARLYKGWISEAKQTIENEIRATEDTSRRKKLELLAIQMDHTIQSTTVLYSLASSNKMKKQVTMATVGEISSQESLHIWLGMDGSDTSNDQIQEAMSIENTVKELEEDLEEERELDDNDDDEDDLFLSSRRADEKYVMTGNEDGWATSFNKKRVKHAIRALLSNASPLEEEEAKSIKDILEIPYSKRRDLYKYWLDSYRVLLKEMIQEHERSYSNMSRQLQEVKDIETITILNEAMFVGMTTTGAAKYRKIMQKVRPKIIIVEEAAEVLESHIVTSLNADCEHLILIGDHKQLRPSTTVYDLAKRYHLDISLFERMVNNGMPCVTLREQHRMRPEISELLRYPELYPELMDHESVNECPPVNGIKGNFLFISHNEEESRSNESTSYSNKYEARYIAAFTKHLLKQGYTSDRITVLTPYMGQVLLLRNHMPKIEYEGVRITAVDNYQGEENDIILLSLVRSSDPGVSGFSKNPIGFVGIENRICVALSRAKIGFYVIGNFELFNAHSEMWRYMTSIMNNKRQMSKTLTLRCQNHPDTYTSIESPDDFRKVPDGGCQLSCNKHLPCGHICPRACHILDADHKLFKCMKPCIKTTCQLGHQCTKKCYQECGKCNVFVEKTLPLCGHIAKVPCHLEPLRHFCTTRCSKLMSCGHECQKKCGDCTRDKQCDKNCKMKVQKLLACGHFVEAECCENVSDKPCKIACTALLSCLHECAGNCFNCFGGRIHERCKGTCPKTLPCSHRCSFPCSEKCLPCPKKCAWKCTHGIQCENKCSALCKICAEDCNFKCKHRKCSRLCSEDCDVLGCDEPCKKKLDCGHKCSGFCSEKCICILCLDITTRMSLININDESIRYVKLPDCGCVHEASLLDIEMKKNEFSRSDLCKHCPNDACKKPITTIIWRYANIIRKSKRDITTKFETIMGSPQDRALKVQQMLQQMKNLKGLSPTHLLNVEKMTKKPDANLSIIATTCDKLEAICKLTQGLHFASASSSLSMSRSGSPLHPELLIALLLSQRKLSTSDFWKDVDFEIKRLKLFLMMKRSTYSSAQQQVDVLVPGLTDAAMRKLTETKPFTNRKYNAIAKVLNAIADLVGGQSVDAASLCEVKDQLNKL